MKKRIIWSNRNIDPDDWMEAYKEYVELNEFDVNNEPGLFEYVQDELAIQLEDEQCNLNVPTDGRIIAIYDGGFWFGRRKGYGILNNIVSDIFNTAEDYNEWYSDGHNIKGILTHHDGTHYVEYRVIREDRDIGKLIQAMFNEEEISHQKLNYYTKSLHPYVARIYGW